MIKNGRRNLAASMENASVKASSYRFDSGFTMIQNDLGYSVTAQIDNGLNSHDAPVMLLFILLPFSCGLAVFPAAAAVLVLCRFVIIE